MNAMLYVCGNDRDYDNWAAQGSTGWDYNSIQPFMRKSEDNMDFTSSSYHGTGGYLTVSNYSSTDPLIPVLKDAFSQLGYKQLSDYNSRLYNGFAELQGTIRGGERCSAARAFLLPIKSNTRLFVMKGSTVSKVILNGYIATGVNVKTGNADCPNIVLNATKEIILSAGALGSPKILLQSGIGRSADLTPFGISQVVSLPVGNNLQDHVLSVHFLKVNPNAPMQTIDDDLWDVQNYYFYRKGNYSNLGAMNYNGFINITDVNATYPDVQLSFYRFAKSQLYFFTILSNFGFKDEYISTLVKLNYDFEIVMVFTVLLNPKSRGTVKLRSSDPFASPKIVSGFLSVAEDVNTLVGGIQKMHRLIKTDAMQQTSAEFVKFSIPECDSLPYPYDPSETSVSTDYWKCYLKYFTMSLWHPTGTCKMGSSADPTTVVDKKLRVFGISKLRVADASIMPSITTGNTQCPTYMIGEKAADMIKASYP